MKVQARFLAYDCNFQEHMPSVRVTNLNKRMPPKLCCYRPPCCPPDQSLTRILHSTHNRQRWNWTRDVFYLGWRTTLPTVKARPLQATPDIGFWILQTYILPRYRNPCKQQLNTSKNRPGTDRFSQHMYTYKFVTQNEGEPTPGKRKNDGEKRMDSYFLLLSQRGDTFRQHPTLFMVNTTI